LVIGGVPENASNGTGRDRHPGRTLTELGLKAIVDAAQRYVGSVREHVVDLLKVDSWREISDIVLTHIAGVGDWPALPPED
jgi:hypothetical protein